MQVMGHLGAGTLAAVGVAGLRRRPAKLSAVLLPAALGGITPDLIDKAILALEFSRYGRTVGHSLVFFGGILVLWAVIRRSRAPWLGGLVGFWVLGVATHLLGDLGDDAFRGLIQGGDTVSSFFAWPFATPYAWVVRNPHPLGVWPWSLTPLEAAVLGGTVLWLALVGRRAWTARAMADVSAETRSSLNLRRLASFAAFQLKRGNRGDGPGGGS
jgi:hypothetical protein